MKSQGLSNYREGIPFHLPIDDGVSKLQAAVVRFLLGIEGIGGEVEEFAGLWGGVFVAGDIELNLPAVFPGQANRVGADHVSVVEIMEHRRNVIGRERIAKCKN